MMRLILLSLRRPFPIQKLKLNLRFDLLEAWIPLAASESGSITAGFWVGDILAMVSLF